MNYIIKDRITSEIGRLRIISAGIRNYVGMDDSNKKLIKYL